MLTAARKKVPLIPKINKGVETVYGLDNDIAAFAAVATIRASIFHEFLATKRDTARATGSGPNIDLCKIEELHVIGFLGLFFIADKLL
ncbi:MAG: hypothetical protein ACJAZ1_003687 [Yoonia sp.]|jgi:hypothetical protein